jgi:ABC-type polysaccharide/polyol phosphate export permease
MLSCVWDFAAATINAGMTLAIGVYGFNAQLRWNGILEIVGAGLLTSFAMGALGLLSVSWTLVSGRGDFLRPFLVRILPLLSGAFFPIALFPEWVREIAWFFPFTHALTLVRGIFMGAVEAELQQAWLTLLEMTIILAVAAWLIFGFAVRQARINGRMAAV